MNQPLISIIVCTYNRKQFLPETIESIFNQQYSPVEIIIIDDGSTDGTEELLKRYAGRVHYYRQENQGITAARNHGCRKAVGELITFQDDDDPMPDNKLVDLQHALQEYPQAVFAVGDLAVIDNHGQLTGERWLPENNNNYSDTTLIIDAYTAVLWPTVPATPNTVLFKRSAAEKLDWFDPDFTVGSEDKDFYARLAQTAPIVYLPKIITFYRRGHASMTNKPALISYSQIILFTKHLKTLSPEFSALRNRLQERILIALKELKRHESTTRDSSPVWLHDGITLGLSMLDIKSKLNYLIHKNIKLPVRKIIRRL